MKSNWPPTRIPINWPPIPGEGLDSWLASYAHRLRTPTRHFLTHLGLPGNSLPMLVRHLTGPERELLTATTGVPEPTLEAMTLAPFSGTVITLETATRKLGRPPSWKRSGTRSRYCPACLEQDGGRWQLSWRLPWSFACLRHLQLLLDTCPACHIPPVMFKDGQIPDPGRCIRTAQSKRCGYDLTTAPAQQLSPHSGVLQAQEEINQTVLVPGQDTSDVRLYSQELRITAQRILAALTTHGADAPEYVHGVLAECGPKPPRRTTRDSGPDAHDTAVSTTLARTLLGALPAPAQPATAPDAPGGTTYAALPRLTLSPAQHDQAQAAWAWLRDSNLSKRNDTEYPIAWAHSWTQGSTRLAAHALAHVNSGLSWTTQLRYGTTTPTPAFPTLSQAQAEHRATKIPAMLWPAWTQHLLPHTPAPAMRPNATPVPEGSGQGTPGQTRVGSPLAGFRRAAAALLVLPGTDLTHPQAARLFGHSLAKPHWDALYTVLGDSSTTMMTTLLVHLARALDVHEVPIDYQRRRALFTEGEILFDTDAHHAYMRRHGHYPSSRHAERMRWQVRRLLLGAEPGDASTSPLWQQRNSHLIDPELRRLITEQAQRNLDAHHLAEPLQWEPPHAWIPDELRPDAPATGIDRKQLAALMPHRPSLDQAAAAAGTNPDRLRLFYETCPDTAPAAPALTPTARAQGNPIPRYGLLTPEELHRLYIVERRSTPQIAAMTGCTPSVIGRYLKEAGIPIRRRTQPLTAADGTVVTPDWLKRVYLDHGRTTLDIADELGCKSAYVSQLLKRHHIPARALFQSAPSPFTRLGVDLSHDLQVLTSRRQHIRWLRNLTRLTRNPPHPNLTAAAQANDIHRNTICNQLAETEKTLGFGLYHRSPLTPTLRGEALLDEARRLLNLLDNPQ